VRFGVEHHPRGRDAGAADAVCVVVPDLLPDDEEGLAVRRDRRSRLAAGAHRDLDLLADPPGLGLDQYAADVRVLAVADVLPDDQERPVGVSDGG